MFKLFKKKLKESIKSFSKETEEEAKEVNPEALSEEEKQQLEQEEQELQEEETVSEESRAEERSAESPEPREAEKKIPKPSTAEKTAEQPTADHSKAEDQMPDHRAAEQSPEPSTAEQTTEQPTADHSKTEHADSEEKGIIDEYEGKKKGFFGKVFGKKDKKKESEPEQQDKPVESAEQAVDEPETAEKQTTEHREAEKPTADNGTAEHPTPDHSKAEQQTPEHRVAEQPATEHREAEKPTAEPGEAEQQIPEHRGAETQAKTAAHEELFEEDVSDATRKKKGFFSKLRNSVTKFQLTEEKFEELFWEFELALLENNVAMEVIEKIKSDMREQLTQENVSRRGIEDLILSILKSSLEEILDVEPIDIIKRAQEKKPFIITIVGVNGSGKTTTIGKLIRLFQNNDLSVVVAAADTFRAAAIQQLEQHTNNLGVTLIKQEYNSDAAAVAYDAVKHATAKGVDVVLIDTAGRLQSNRNLMDELSKVVRVNKPDFNLFVGEAITGNDCVEQAVQFNNAVGIDGIVLSKADIDDKGGAAISVSYVTKKPILYLGVGQDYDDLEPFTKERILEHLGLEE